MAKNLGYFSLIRNSHKKCSKLICIKRKVIKNFFHLLNIHNFAKNLVCIAKLYFCIFSKIMFFFLCKIDKKKHFKYNKKDKSKHFWETVKLKYVWREVNLEKISHELADYLLLCVYNILVKNLNLIFLAIS